MILLRRTRPAKAVGVGAAAALVFFALTLAGFPGGATQALAGTAKVNGGGSSFAAPEASQWAADVARAPYQLAINYVTSSSGSGRDNYASGLYDYGATDIVYNAEDGSYQQQAATDHPYKYVTISAGGLAFQYNLVIGGERFTGLNLTPSEVCGIFTGEITEWSSIATTTGDGILASLAGTDDDQIEAVVRADYAGESYVLSQYCQAVEPQEWASFKGWVDTNEVTISYSDPNMAAGQPVSLWPGTLINNDRSVSPQSGAIAAANFVNNPNTGQNSIDYEAAVYAQQLSAPVASVENSAGYFVQPDANSVQLALSYATPNSLGTFDLDFKGPNPGAYFPSTYSYILDPTTTKTPDHDVNSPLNQWLCYSIGQGQQEAASLLYAPLSSQVTTLSRQAIESTPEAPAAARCGQGGPSPSTTPGHAPPPKGPGPTTTGHPRPPVKATPGGGDTTATTTLSGNTGGADTTTTVGSSSSGTSPQGRSVGRSARGGGHARGPGSSEVTTPGGPGASPTAGAGPQVLAVAAASKSTSTPVGNQALWWVLGGAVLAAGVSWLVGLTRRGAP